jgi:hypothetical protein
MQIEVHGKKCVVIGTRCFAVRKDLDNAERIANMSQGPGNYQRSMRIPDSRVRNTRSIKG